MINFTLVIVVLSLAGFRYSEFLINDKGPFSIFEKFRNFMGVDRKETFFTELLTCINCLSVWVAAITLGSYYIYPPSIYFHAFFAVSTLIIAVNNRIDGPETE